MSQQAAGSRWADREASTWTRYAFFVDLGRLLCISTTTFVTSRPLFYSSGQMHR